ncbi:MAG: glucose-1-phosphate cytidylyltransferase [Candidatus Melainabacteria bacterium RIFOXYA12_FULL_32_12]|nr:MAG: glucose-1-phosphate cytidylyltransferase [Candidatus Melainabacteria bacterium RIFOXYA12_FULL_32_12]
MKAIILAGGLGSRISEESHLKPKPMIEIGGKPILWHIMKIYSHYGINDFIICTGYKGYVIKEYFANYYLHQSDITFDMRDNKMHIHNNDCEPWKVTIIDTGESTNTGGRVKRAKPYVDDETFCLTYGDGVSNINIQKLIEFHKKESSLATLTAVQPPGRFGAIEIGKNQVTAFQEKPIGDGNWINGGFFILEPAIFDLIKDDFTSWEADILTRLTEMNKLSAYKHTDFWFPMDTLRDKNRLEELWNSGKAPWKVWD